MKIAEMALAELVPAEDNPRRISDAAYAGLKRSIERFGLVEPVVFNERSGRAVGGQQRQADRLVGHEALHLRLP